MKRADAAQTANPASRPEKPGKMKSQRFSSPLTVRPLTVVAIDVLGSVFLRHWNYDHLPGLPIASGLPKVAALQDLF
jgi:hypothetical protein